MGRPMYAPVAATEIVPDIGRGEKLMQQLLVGLDVGSTTVKAVVVDAATDSTIWQDYQRHETRQPE